MYQVDKLVSFWGKTDERYNAKVDALLQTRTSNYLALREH